MPTLLLKVMNIQQGAHYLDIMQNDSSQERFARGWLKPGVALQVKRSILRQFAACAGKSAGGR